MESVFTVRLASRARIHRSRFRLCEAKSLTLDLTIYWLEQVFRLKSLETPHLERGRFATVPASGWFSLTSVTLSVSDSIRDIFLSFKVHSTAT